MTQKQISYKDEEIRHAKTLKRYYCRTKYNRRSAYLVITIRTQRGGKGRSCASVRAVLGDDKSLSDAYKRLARKFGKFYFVVLHSVDDVFGDNVSN